MKNKYENIIFDRVQVSSNPGSHLHDCQKEAVKMSMDLGVDVVLVHNGQRYDIIFTRIIDSIERR